MMPFEYAFFQIKSSPGLQIKTLTLSLRKHVNMPISEIQQQPKHFISQKYSKGKLKNPMSRVIYQYNTPLPMPSYIMSAQTCLYQYPHAQCQPKHVFTNTPHFQRQPQEVFIHTPRPIVAQARLYPHTPSYLSIRSTYFPTPIRSSTSLPTPQSYMYVSPGTSLPTTQGYISAQAHLYQQLTVLSQPRHVCTKHSWSYLITSSFYQQLTVISQPRHIFTDIPVGPMSAETRLYHDLMANYSRHIRPRWDPNARLTVATVFSLKQIQSVVSQLWSTHADVAGTRLGM